MLTKDTILYRKAFAFAVRVVKLHRYLIGEKKEFVLSKAIASQRYLNWCKYLRSQRRNIPIRFFLQNLDCVQRIAGNEILVVSPERNRIYYRKCSFFTSQRCG
jgi:hypothetical protein